MGRGQPRRGGANHGEAGPPTEGEVDRRGRRRSFPGLGKVGIQGGTGGRYGMKGKVIRVGIGGTLESAEATPTGRREEGHQGAWRKKYSL